MEDRMEKDMFLTYCCRCGYRVGKTAPGSNWMVTCPKCGSELEIKVEGTVVQVAVLKMRQPQRAMVAR